MAQYLLIESRDAFEYGDADYLYGRDHASLESLGMRKGGGKQGHRANGRQTHKRGRSRTAAGS